MDWVVSDWIFTSWTGVRILRIIIVKMWDGLVCGQRSYMPLASLTSTKLSVRHHAAYVWYVESMGTNESFQLLCKLRGKYTIALANHSLRYIYWVTIVTSWALALWALLRNPPYLSPPHISFHSAWNYPSFLISPFSTKCHEPRDLRRPSPMNLSFRVDFLPDPDSVSKDI